jgi:hypothetical protein
VENESIAQGPQAWLRQYYRTKLTTKPSIHKNIKVLAWKNAQVALIKASA